MKPVLAFLLVLTLGAGGAFAQEPPHPAGPFPATQLAWEAQLYKTRPVVVFADSGDNPNFLRQAQLLERDLAALSERDVVVIYDTDPSIFSEWRQRLRPRGFSMVILDKDMRVVSRHPMPTTARDVGRAIDSLPSRRQEVLERFGSGR